MAKKKNKGKKNVWDQSLRPWMRGIRRNRGWLSAIGGAIGGAALLSAITSQRGQRLISELTTSAESLVPKGNPQSNSKPDSASKPKAAANT